MCQHKYSCVLTQHCFMCYSARMTMFHDAVIIDARGLSRTKDGYLVGDGRIARAGNVQQYYGYEIGLTGNDANQVFGVYRDPDMVFDREAMMSLAGRPITRGHPENGVTADNWAELSKGQVGGVIRKDGEHVVAPMAIMDASAADEVANGATSLSAGYSCKIVKDEGVAPDGTPYQFKQAGPLRFNHVAYLPDNNPRAGNTRMGDAGDAPITQADNKEVPMSTVNVVLGDKAVAVAAADAPAVEAFKADAAKKLEDAKAAHDAAIAAKDAEIAKKDAEIDALKGKVLEGAALDAAVAARGDLIATAKVISPNVKTDGVADADIRKAVVIDKRGDAVKDKSQAYFDAAFDILAEDAEKVDPVRFTLANDAPAQPNDSHAGYLSRMSGKKEA